LPRRFWTHVQGLIQRYRGELDQRDIVQQFAEWRDEAEAHLSEVAKVRNSSAGAC